MMEYAPHFRFFHPVDYSPEIKRYIEVRQSQRIQICALGYRRNSLIRKRHAPDKSRHVESAYKKG